MKHILFIGDFRPANNYGSIATTETLEKLLVNVAKDAEIRIIDKRSYGTPTPLGGFLPLNVKDNSVKGIIKRMVPATLIPQLQKWNKKLKKGLGLKRSHMPYRYSLFEEYYKDMMSGQYLQYEKELFEWADIVMVNGEGTIVNGTDKEGKYSLGGLYTLYMTWLAKEKFKKPTCLVNHTVDPANSDAYEIIEKLYPKLDYVCVREPLSLVKLKEHGITNAQFIPDSLFSYTPVEDWKPSAELSKQIDFSKPYICVGDSAGIWKNPYLPTVKWDVVEVFSNLITELQKVVPQIIFVDGFNESSKEVNKVIKKFGLGYVNLNNCSYHDLFYVFKGAEIFISGRWHNSILSCVANTPILLWGSDSHKTRALYTILDNYPYTFFNINSFPIHTKDMADSARSVIENKVAVKKLIKEKVDIYSKLTVGNVAFVKDFIDGNLKEVK